MKRTFFRPYHRIAQALCTVAVGLTILFSPAAFAVDAKFDHVHMRVPDPAKAAAWYAQYMGGTVIPEPGYVVDFGRTVLRFEASTNPKPTEGSVLDHLGFSFPDLAAKLAELEKANVKIVSPLRDVPGIFKFAFIEDPWGGKIEVVEDHDLLGFHHVHLRGPDPDALLNWVQTTFGGERVKVKTRIDAVKQGEINIFALKSPEATVRSEDHVIDHIGYSVSNLGADLPDLAAQGVNVTKQIQVVGPIKWALVESPTGVKVELIQWK